MGKCDKHRTESDRTTYSLNIHDHSFSSSEVILNPESFTHLNIGDYIEICQEYTDRESKLILQIDSFHSVKGSKLHVSLLKSVADMFCLQPWTSVMVNEVDSSTVSVDFVEFTIKDQFISRADMLKFKKSLFRSTVYRGKSFNTLGVRANVQTLTIYGRHAKSGVLTEQTNFNFRSRSSRIFWLVQISMEMYEYAPCGQLYFEIFINDFVKKLLQKWKVIQATHSLTVIFFSRTFFLNTIDSLKFQGGLHDRAVRVRKDGKSYEDSYKVVIENETTFDPEKITLKLKTELISFPKVMDWYAFSHPTAFGNVHEESLNDGWAMKEIESQKSYVGVPSYASHGNFLEAINVTLNVLEKHYMDRDLYRIGNSIVALSTCNGVFEVDPNIASITQQRMMDNGIGMDMVSLSQPPLHTAPLFIFYDYLSNNSSCRRYEVPHWMNLSFAIVPNESDNDSSNDSFKNMNDRNLVASSFVRPPVLKLFNTPQLTFDSNYHREEKSFLSLPLKVLLGLKDVEYSSIKTTCIKTKETGVLHMWGLCHPLADHGITLVKGSEGISSVPIFTQTKEYSLSEDFESSVSPSSGCTIQSSLKDGSIFKFNIGSYEKVLKRPFPDMNDHVGPPELYTHNLHPIWHRSSSDKALRTNHENSFIDHSTKSMTRNFSDCEKQDVHYRYPGISDYSDSCCKERDALVFAQKMIKENVRKPPVPYASQKELSTNVSRIQKRMHIGKIDKAIKEKPNVAMTTGPSIQIEEKVKYFEGDQKRSKPAHVIKENILSNRSKTAVVLKFNQMNAVAGGKSRQESNSNNKDINFFEKIKQSTLQLFFSWEKMIKNSFQYNGYQCNSLFLDDSSNSQRIDESASIQRLKKSTEIEASSSNLNSDSPCSGTINIPGSSTFAVQDIKTQEQDKTKVIQPPSISPIFYPKPVYIRQLTTAHKNPPPRQHLSCSFDENYGPTLPGSNLNTKCKACMAIRTAVSPYQEPINSSNGLKMCPNNSSKCESISKEDLKQNFLSKDSDIERKDIALHRMRNNCTLKRMPAKNSDDNRLQSCEASLWESSLFNPFKRQDEQQLLRIRTHNRRRWSHVFPAGEVEFKHMPGPIWKSLCQPALLPLTTDYLPKPEILEKNYNLDSVYTLTLPDQDDSFTKNYASDLDLLDELVCQRDFQLVDGDVVSGGRVKSKTSIGNTTLVAGSTKYNSSFANRMSSLSSQKVAFTLSMGHRIHILTYDEQTKQVDVKRFVSKDGTNSRPENKLTYCYSLWERIQGRFQTVQQTFLKYPSPEYSWNYLDELVCGYNSIMKESLKYRRVLFAIIPPQISSAEDEAVYLGKLRRLIDFINAKVKDGNVLEHDFITFFDAENNEQKRFDNHRQLYTCAFSQSVKVILKERSFQKDRHEWLRVEMDKKFGCHKIIHINIYWVVCSGCNVTEYVFALKRRTQQIGLKLVQVPQYSLGSNIHVHPFVTHVYVHVPNIHTRRYLSLRLLFNSSDFVGDNYVYTNWKEFGVDEGDDVEDVERDNNLSYRSFIQASGITSSLNQTQWTDPKGSAAILNGKIPAWKYKQQQQQHPQYQQQQQEKKLLPAFCHRSGNLFIREAPKGLQAMSLTGTLAETLRDTFDSFQLPELMPTASLNEIRTIHIHPEFDETL